VWPKPACRKPLKLIGGANLLRRQFWKHFPPLVFATIKRATIIRASRDEGHLDLILPKVTK
jgi:hypothetical protein